MWVKVITANNCVVSKLTNIYVIDICMFIIFIQVHGMTLLFNNACVCIHGADNVLNILEFSRSKTIVL